MSFIRFDVEPYISQEEAPRFSRISNFSNGEPAHHHASRLTAPDALTTWLAEPVQMHCEPPVEHPTVTDLEALPSDWRPGSVVDGMHWTPPTTNTPTTRKQPRVGRNAGTHRRRC